MLTLEEILEDAPLFADFADGVCANLACRALSGETPLHLMASLGDDQAMELLLQAGADINALDSAGNTPLHAAVLQRQILAVRYLIACGADRSIRNVEGQTPRMLAETDGNHDLARAL